MTNMHAANVRPHGAKYLSEKCHQARADRVGHRLQPFCRLPLSDRRPASLREPPDGDPHRAGQPTGGGPIRGRLELVPRESLVRHPEIFAGLQGWE